MTIQEMIEEIIKYKKNKPLKILITVGIFPPDIGGPASFVPKNSKFIKENEHEVTVICLTDEKILIMKFTKVIRILRNQNLIIRWIKTVFNMIRSWRKC